MYSLIRERLINYNKEFKELYNKIKSDNKLVEFNNDDFQIFSEISCSKREPSLTLAQAFSTGINNLEAGMISLYLSESIHEDYTLHIGKLYLLRGHSQIYDCEHTWIETNTHIIDPLLLIKLEKEYKEQFLYQTLRTVTKEKVDQLGYSNDEYLLFILNKLNRDADYKEKLTDFKPMPTIKECISYSSDKVEGLFIRDYLINSNEQFKEMYNYFKTKGDILELEGPLNQMPELICSKKNPNITLKYIFEQGLNIGNCGLVCRFFAETLDAVFSVHNGICNLIKGTYSSFNGEHAWVETEKYIYDTTIMVRIPVELKEQFGYTTESIINKEDVKPDYRTQEYIYSIDRREQTFEGAKERKYIIDESREKK